MTVSGYLRRGKQRFGDLARRPELQMGAEGALYGGGAMLLCAVEHQGRALPVGAVLAMVSPGWRCFPAAVGAGLGYRLLFGSWQGVFWTAAALVLGILLRLSRKDSFWILEVSSLMVPAVTDTVLRLPGETVFLDSLWGGLAGGLFFLAPRAGEPLLHWAAAGLALRALTALGALPLACGLAALCCGCLPGAVLLGLPLETAGVPGITAALCGGYLAGHTLLPRKWRIPAVPGTILLTGICLGVPWNIGAWLGVSMGGLLAWSIPWRSRQPGTGGARVQLELAARTLAGLNRNLLEQPRDPAESAAALLEKLRQESCGDCPSGGNCQQKDHLDESIFRDPLSFTCRRTGRMLRAARQVRERQRLLGMQHRKLLEYRMALAQQYGMLSRYLQRVADGLPLGESRGRIRYRVSVSVRSKGKHRVDGDCCAAFPGLAPRFYVLLCDGCGTGAPAARSSSQAVRLLKQMLTAGLPPRYALGSLNSQLVLTGQAGAVTADLAEIRLDTGSAVLYKWGAAQSLLLRRKKTVRLGEGSLPPGVRMEAKEARLKRLSLNRGETLVMASDGVSFEGNISQGDSIEPTAVLAQRLLREYGTVEDDATVAVIRLGEMEGSA